MERNVIQPDILFNSPFCASLATKMFNHNYGMSEIELSSPYKLEILVEELKFVAKLEILRGACRNLR